MADAVADAIEGVRRHGEVVQRFGRTVEAAGRTVAMATLVGDDGDLRGWWVGDAVTGAAVGDGAEEDVTTAAAQVDYLARAFAFRHDWLVQIAGHAASRASGLAHVDAIIKRLVERDPALAGHARRYLHALEPLHVVAEAGAALDREADGFLDWFREVDPIPAGRSSRTAHLVDALAAYDAAADSSAHLLRGAEHAAQALDDALEAAGHPARQQLPAPQVLGTWTQAGDGGWSAALFDHVMTLQAVRRG